MIAQALRRVRVATSARDKAQERFEESLRAAVAAGASLRAVAEAAGITGARVGQIVGPVGDQREGAKNDG